MENKVINKTGLLSTEFSDNTKCSNNLTNVFNVRNFYIENISNKNRLQTVKLIGKKQIFSCPTLNILF